MDSKRAVLVRPMGTVGVGKSTLLNSLLGYPRLDARKPWMCVQHFTSGTSTAGIRVDSRVIIKTNPTLIDPEETLLFGDTEGIGSSSGDSVEVCDKILRQMQSDPSTLLLVSRADRTDIPFINVLHILKRCSSIANDNCVLVCTKAEDKPNGLDSADISPTNLITELMMKTGLEGVFSETDHNGKTKNVVCVDFDEHYEANLVKIRNMLLQRKACVAKCTYSELKATAQGGVEDNQNAIKIKKRELEHAEYERNWHERRIRDLTISIASTGWIPFVGPVSSAGMMIAIADSEAKVKKWDREIEELKAARNNYADVIRKAQQDVKDIENMLQR